MPKLILGVKLYTSQETAELLGVTLPTLTKYVTGHRLAKTKIGGRSYFSEENIKSFLQNSEY